MAVVGAEAKVDGGGCARALRQRKEEDEAKRNERGNEKMTPGPIYKAKG